MGQDVKRLPWQKRHPLFHPSPAQSCASSLAPTRRYALLAWQRSLALGPSASLLVGRPAAACFATPVEAPETVREATWPTSPAAPKPLPEPIEEAAAEIQVDGGSWAIGVESFRMLSTAVLSGKMDGSSTRLGGGIGRDDAFLIMIINA